MSTYKMLHSTCMVAEIISHVAARHPFGAGSKLVRNKFHGCMFHWKTEMHMRAGALRWTFLGVVDGIRRSCVIICENIKQNVTIHQHVDPLNRWLASAKRSHSTNHKNGCLFIGLLLDGELFIYLLESTRGAC